MNNENIVPFPIWFRFTLLTTYYVASTFTTFGKYSEYKWNIMLYWEFVSVCSFYFFSKIGLTSDAEIEDQRVSGQ